jgi:putative FmdB family regulatory protein
VPIYEYRCEKGHSFEVIQRMADAPVTECEECGAPVQRVLHAPAVHFKGSGFYNTDYGTKKRSRELKEAAEGGSSSGGGADSKDGGSGSDKSGDSSSSEKKGDGAGSDGSSSSAKPKKPEAKPAAKTGE